MGKEEDLRRMFQELTGYEKKKIDLKMEGIPASPMQIVLAHEMREGVTYMRDYVPVSYTHLLKEVPVKVGDYVEAKTVLGYVSQPTKYYSVEGCNVYFEMRKDGQPVNPIEYMEE